MVRVLRRWGGGGLTRPLCRWSLPNALPLILLNGATGTKDSLTLSFRATFANMISIIAQLRFASVSDPGEDVVIVQVCRSKHHSAL